MKTKINRDKILIILGATSTGKTDLAIYLAKNFNGELVSCDSRQLYTGLDIGTGKLPGKEVAVRKSDGFWEMDGLKVWMYDIANPKTQYTVYAYVKNAKRIIDKILKRGNLPIIVGGNGFYLKALFEGLPNLEIPANQKLRKELEKLSLQELQESLQKLSPKKWEEMNNSDKQNPRRLTRAIEVISSVDINNTDAELMSIKNRLSIKDNILKIGLIAPREILYQRIDKRVVSRINQGMIDEAKELHRRGLSFKRMKQLGLEYGILADYLTGKITSKEEFIKILQGKIHDYARRQITWFKKEEDINWFDITTNDWVKKVESLIHSWYYSSND